MKFAALALALLLAVGSQAASLQSDAPSQLDHFRGAARTFLVQARDSAKNIIGAVDDPQYAASVAQAKDYLDIAVKWLLEKQTQAAPYTDTFLAPIQEAAAGVRETYNKEVEALKTDLETKFDNVKLVLEKHMEEYRQKLAPIIAEYRAKNAEDMAALKLKLEPVYDDLSRRVPANWQETREALVPLFESVKSRIESNSEAVKGALVPYIEDYRDQLRGASSQMNLSEEKMNQIREKIGEIIALFQS